MDVGRVAAVIAAQSPDIVALQELDVGRARTGHVDQAERLVKVGPLPGHPRFGGLEPRGALWVAIDIDGMDLQVINTHLGLVPLEQREQAKALAGPGWLGGAKRADPLMLVGDFNATRLARAYSTLAADLTESRRCAPRGDRVPTFPSR